MSRKSAQLTHPCERREFCTANRHVGLHPRGGNSFTRVVTRLIQVFVSDLVPLMTALAALCVFHRLQITHS
jgi:sorbitol-specific phosphotransferase system component IIC